MENNIKESEKERMVEREKKIETGKNSKSREVSKKTDKEINI